MTLETDINALKSLPIFEGVDAKRLKLVAMMSEKFHYRPGDHITSEGDVPERIYILLSGQVELSRNDPCGHQYALVLGSGSLFGDVPTLCERPYLINATATTDVVVLGLCRHIFIEMLETVPGFAVALCRDLAGRLYTMTKRIVEREWRPEAAVNPAE